MALGQNIFRLRTEKNLSQDELATLTGWTEENPKAGVSQGAISALEKRDSKASAHAPALAMALHVSVDELITGVRDTFNEPAQIRNQIAQDKNDTISIPLLANSGAMGDGVAQLDGDMVIGAMTLQAGWAAKHLPNILPRNLRFIHGYGDSMKPTFTDGDILLVDSGAINPDIDGVYVLEVKGKIYIKRITRRFSGQHEISSDNEGVKTVEVLNGDHMVEIKGRVVWAWKGERL